MVQGPSPGLHGRPEDATRGNVSRVNINFKPRMGSRYLFLFIFTTHLMVTARRIMMNPTRSMAIKTPHIM